MLSLFSNPVFRADAHKHKVCLHEQTSVHLHVSFLCTIRTHEKLCLWNKKICSNLDSRMCAETFSFLNSLCGVIVHGIS